MLSVSSVNPWMSEKKMVSFLRYDWTWTSVRPEKIWIDELEDGMVVLEGVVAAERDGLRMVNPRFEFA
jgi:hypothetical protein